MISWPPYPIPVVVEKLGPGYILYIKGNGIYQNDEFCVVLLNGGKIIHATSIQLRVERNDTYKITQNESD